MLQTWSKSICFDQFFNHVEKSICFVLRPFTSSKCFGALPFASKLLLHSDHIFQVEKKTYIRLIGSETIFIFNVRRLFVSFTYIRLIRLETIYISCGKKQKKLLLTSDWLDFKQYIFHVEKNKKTFTYIRLIRL